MILLKEEGKSHSQSGADLSSDRAGAAIGGISRVRGASGQVYCADADNVVLYEPLQNHGGEGGNVLFCDGHVEFVPQADWEQVLRDGGVNLP